MSRMNQKVAESAKKQRKCATLSVFAGMRSRTLSGADGRAECGRRPAEEDRRRRAMKAKRKGKRMRMVSGELWFGLCGKVVGGVKGALTAQAAIVAAELSWRDLDLQGAGLNKGDSFEVARRDAAK